jgi:hypothetical protein
MTEKKPKKPEASKAKTEEIKRLDDLIELLETENEALGKMLKSLNADKDKAQNRE